MAEKKFSDLTAKAATIADTDLVAISESAGGGTYTSKSVTGANIKALVTDANMTTTDITTNDVSTSKHGFAPKAPNDTTKFLRGDATWAVVSAGGLTNFTEAEATTSPNNTVYVDSLTAAGSTTNADIAIVPKGTGAFTLAVADNTTTGGNKRGTNAIDLQTLRTNANQVASGNSSVVIGVNSRASSLQGVAIGVGSVSGAVNAVALGVSASATANGSLALNQGSATGTNSIAFGTRAKATNQDSLAMGGYTYVDTTASGLYSTAIGGGNTASGDFSIAFGGYYNTASGYMSYASGNTTSTFGVTGRQTRGYYNTAIGDCQRSEFFLTKRTTDAIASTLTVGGGVASNANQVILSNNSAYRFKGTIIGKQSGSTNASVWDIDGFIVRGANAAATTLNVSNVTLVQNTPAWGTPTLTADTTNGGLQVQVTGAAATNIQWTAVIETTEVIYA